ncbi:MAG: hypothetical protein GWM91_02645, partial [Actinobacteria bacterium]|nr:hypothetical protein [Actinomycetota bacterium]NIV54514.1 hypothetical protein [Actinomycetota bacterium]NIX49398.1 hypothetical protein [Actinomycetota bacterium]
NLDEPESRGKAAAGAARLIALHPDAVVRHEYAVMVSRRTGVALDVVESAVRGALPRTGGSSPPPSRRLSGREKTERELL